MSPKQATTAMSMTFSRRPASHIISCVGILFMVLLMVDQAYRRHDHTNISSDRTTEFARDPLLDDINNNTLGFQKIFVVGMPSRTDRRDGMVLQAALSDMDIEFIDSNDGKAVVDKAIPSGADFERPSDPVIGCWRGHLDALREVVRRNLTSALIMEDDVDWDVRIRQQLGNFALGSRALLQPAVNAPGAYTRPKGVDTAFPSLGQLDWNDLPVTVNPKISPYGDDWDVLWIGHCGQRFPFADSEKVPKGRVVQKNDVTAAQKNYLGSVIQPFEYAEEYPDHTRVVHHVQDGVCMLAYAVSQQGARALLYEIGLKPYDGAFDFQFHWACSGEHGRNHHRCLTVQPPLVQHHRPAGPSSKHSDISDHGESMSEKARTEEIRWSVRMNAEVLLRGDKGYIDQYPDV